jgi:hypothetical protein
MNQKLASIELLTVGETSAQKARTRVVACQACSGSVSRPFSSVLTEVLGAVGPAAEYVICEPVECPNCSRPIIENTMVRCEDECEERLMPAYPPDVPCWEETDVILVDEAALLEAQSVIAGCEQCVPYAEMTFDYILDAVTGYDPTKTEYVLCHSAKCPRCQGEVSEKTFVLPR